MVVLTCCVFVVTYALIATERVGRVPAALGGAATLAVLRVVDAEAAFFSRDTGIDWNVIFLLFGMMIIVSVLKQTGLFEYLGLWAVARSGGRPFRLMVLLIWVTAGASALLDNVTTVLLVAPVTMTVCRQLNLPSGPYLIVLAFASNIGGTATLIGDPPNIIIASRAGLTFADFLVHLAPIVVLLLVAFTGLCWLLFGRRLDRLRAGMPTPPQQYAIEAITDRRLLARCLVILLAVMLGFVLHSALHLDPSMVAMLGAGAMVLTARATPQQLLEEVEWATPQQLLEEVEWATLVFFMGLFVLVGGLVRVGVIDMLGRAATDAMGERYLLAASSLLFGSAVLGAVVDNIPYTTAMAPMWWWSVWPPDTTSRSASGSSPATDFW